MNTNNSPAPKPQKLDDAQLLRWAVSRVQECQNDKFYGKLTVHFENGRIVRTTSEKSEIPS